MQFARIISPAAAGIALLFAAGCGSPPPPVYEPIAFESGDNFMIHCTVEDEFSIPITENPTTGYVWEWKIDTPQVVQKVNDEFIPPEIAMPGAPGVHVFTFKGNNAGCAVIEFTEFRPFEGADSTTRKFNVNVLVSPLKK